MYKRATPLSTGCLGSRDLGTGGLEILPYQHFRPASNRMTVIAGCILAFRIVPDHGMASLRHRYSVACCIFHIMSIPFNCRDTVLRVAEAMIGAKAKSFVFCHVCFVSRIWRQNSSPRSLAFSHLFEPG